MQASKLWRRYFSLEHAWGQGEFGIGDVVSHLGLGAGHARFIVDRLLKAGCCYRISRGRYRLIGTRDWISLQKFRSLFPRLAPKVIPLLTKNMQNIHSARLCGSFYRGEQDRLSDVDLFIITTGQETRETIKRDAKSLNKRLGTRLAPNVLDWEDFERLCRGSFSPFITLIDSMALVDDGMYRCTVFKGIEENFYGIVQMELEEAGASFNACLKDKGRLTLRDLAYLAMDAWRRVVVVELMLGDELFTMADISKGISSAVRTNFAGINRIYRIEKLTFSCDVHMPAHTSISREDILDACRTGLERLAEVRKNAEAKEAAAKGR